MLYFYFHALGIMMKINMYRKVTTLISFAAFVLFGIIMCPLGMYGQESKWVDMNPVRERYLLYLANLDTTFLCNLIYPTFVVLVVYRH